jgi:hypothetical protein
MAMEGSWQMAKKSQKAMEIAFCERLALTMNATKLTDYHAQEYEAEKSDIDCFLKSQSGKFPRRDLQVVTVPPDGTLRENSGTILKLKSELSSRLKQRGQDRTRIWLNLNKLGRGTKWKPSELDKLTSLICEMAAHKRPLLGDVEIWQYSAELSALIYDVGFNQAATLDGITVDISMGDFIPENGEWIEQAIRQKLQKYGAKQAAKISLVIGGLGLLGLEQIKAFQDGHSASEFPFQEIWVVSHYGTVQLK